jgi:hypothetical protein
MDILTKFDPLYLKVLVTGSFMAVYTLVSFLAGASWKKTITCLLLALLWLTQSPIVYPQVVEIGMIILAGIGLGLCANDDLTWSWGTLAIQVAIPLLVAFALSWMTISVVKLENDILIVSAKLALTSLVTLGLIKLIGRTRRARRLF